MGRRRLLFADDAHRRHLGRMHLRPDPGPAARVAPAEDPAIQVIGLLALARGAICARRLADAESSLRRAIDLDGGSAEAHTLMGVVHELLGEPHAAYHSFKAALEADPWYAPAAAGLRGYCRRYGLGFDNEAMNPAARRRRPLECVPRPPAGAAGRHREGAGPDAEFPATRPAAGSRPGRG